MQDDQELSKIAIYGRNTKFRLRALEQIKDPELVRQVAAEAHQLSIRARAVERLEHAGYQVTHDNQLLRARAEREMRRGNLAKAIDFVNQLIEKSKSDASNFSLRSELRDRIGDFQGSQEDRRQAAVLERSDQIQTDNVGIEPQDDVEMIDPSVNANRYLAFTAEEYQRLNEKGLAKLLFIRREVIHLKHLMQSTGQGSADFFEELKRIEIDRAAYQLLLLERLRRILRAPRQIDALSPGSHQLLVRNADTFTTLTELKIPFLFAIDFARTITNRDCQDRIAHLQQSARDRGQFWIVSADGSRGSIEKYVAELGLGIPASRIVAAGSVQAKLRKLFDLARQSNKPMLLHLDDDERVCQFAFRLGFHSYRAMRLSATATRLERLRFSDLDSAHKGQKDF